MTGDEARELFSAAHEGDLGEDDRQAFRAALAASPELSAEFAEFQELLRGAARLSEEVADETPDLLAGVQHKLRARSGGRYYRDRFAAGGGRAVTLLPLVLGAAMLVVIATIWVVLNYVEVDMPAAPGVGAMPAEANQPRPSAPAPR